MSCCCTKFDGLVLIILNFILLTAFMYQANGSLAIAVADEVAYVTAGVNLVRDGRFINAFGEQETWFPPIYPVAIGLVSGGGRIDPHWVARLLSLLCGMGCLVETYLIAKAFAKNRWVPVLAATFLVCNPTFQLYACAALSESMTLFFELAAFACWIYLEQQLLKRWLLVGSLIALATLTRPECILLLPAFAAIDLLRSRSRDQMISMAIGMGLCAILLLPYAFYLRSATGKFTITNKGEVNLAGGRSDHYKTPREYIDPQTLTMGYYPNHPTRKQEAERYLTNVGKLLNSVRAIYRGPTVLIMLLLLVLGIASLIQAGDYRLLAGLAAQCAYLLVVPVYDVGGEKNLHAILPAMSLLLAVGLGGLLARITPWKFDALHLSAGIVLILSGLVLLEGVTRTPRWLAQAAGTQKAIFRSAGEKLATLEKQPAVVYEIGATIGYYAGQRRGRLTQNELATITSFIDRREPADQQVYLAFAEGEKLDPTVLALSQSNGNERWQWVFEMGQAKQKVSVFKLHRRD